MHVHGINSRSRDGLVLIEEEIRESRTGQASCKAGEGRTVWVIGREGVGREEHAAIIERRVDDTIEGTAAVARVCCDKRKGGQRLFGNLGSVDGVGAHWIGARGHNIVRRAGDAGIRCAGQRKRRAARCHDNCRVHVRRWTLETIPQLLDFQAEVGGST